MVDDRRDQQALLSKLGDLIATVARDDAPTHSLVETVKWGQRSFALSPKQGTAVRLGLSRSGEVALLVHCGTSVIDDWRDACEITGRETRTEGKRAFIVDPDRLDDAKDFIRSALSYRKG
jgi:hypothetical protein